MSSLADIQRRARVPITTQSTPVRKSTVRTVVVRAAPLLSDRSEIAQLKDELEKARATNAMLVKKVALLEQVKITIDSSVTINEDASPISKILDDVQLLESL